MKSIEKPITYNSVVYALLLAAVGTSMTIPRAGTKVSEVPITLPSVLYGLLVLLWVCRPASRIRISTGYRSMHEGLAVYGTTGFVLMGVVSLLVGFIRVPDAKESLINAAGIIGYVPIFFIVREFVNSPDRLRQFSKVIIGSTLIVSVYGIIQYIFGHYTVMIPGITICYSDAFLPRVFEEKCNLTAVGLKVVSTFQNGNLFGNFLALVLPLCIALSAVSSGRKRFFFVILSILVMVNITLSLSRGSIIVSLISLLILVRYMWPARVPCYFLIGYAAIGLLCIFGLQLAERILVYDPTAAGRMPMYQDFKEAYESMPVSSLIPVVIFGAGMKGYVGNYGHWVDGTESSLLTILLESGLIGLSLFASALIGSIGFGLKIRQIGKHQIVHPAFAIGLSVGIIGCVAQLGIDQSILLPPSSMNLWAVLGLLMAVGRIVRSE